MKALIRNPGETITERDEIVDIDWDTGAPLTNPSWAGGPYALVEDYQEPVENHDGSQPIQSTPVEEKPAEQHAESADGEVVEGTVHDSARVALPDTVTYGGKEYTLEELKKLIG